MGKKRAKGEGTLYKKSDGRWEVRYTDPREPDPKKQTKYFTSKSQKVVIQKLKKVKAEIEKNEKLLSGENPTVAEWVEKWFYDQHINNCRTHIFEKDLRSFEVHIVPILGHIKMKALESKDIEYFYNILQKKKSEGGHGLAPASVTKLKSLLSGAIKYAITMKIISSNPMEGVKAPPVKKSKIRIFTKEELRKFTATLPFYHAGNLFAFALATGMRIGEICALDIQDINWEHDYIRIDKSTYQIKDKKTGKTVTKIGEPKTESSTRIIPLLDSVKVILRRQLQLIEELKIQAGDKWHENTLVFPTQTGTLRDKNGVRTTMERILTRANIEIKNKYGTLNRHAMRHHYATTALNSGVAPQNVAELLGHKDGATTLKFYAHYINTAATQQLENLEAHNIVNLNISSNELKAVRSGKEIEIAKSNVAERIDKVVKNAKSASPKKSIDMVLRVCNEILCEPIDNLSPTDKDTLLGTIAQYTFMKKEMDKKKNKIKSSWDR